MTELLSEWMELSREERTRHIDLSSPCEAQEGSIGGRSAIALKALLEHHGLTNDIGNRTTAKGGHICHLCEHGSTNGFCVNPEHIYFGTAAENRQDTHDLYEDTEEEFKLGWAIGETWISVTTGFVSTKGPVALHLKGLGLGKGQMAQVPSEIKQSMIKTPITAKNQWRRQTIDKPGRLKVETAWAINLAIYNSFISSSDWSGQAITHIEPLAVFGNNGFGTDSSGGVWVKATGESSNLLPSRVPLTSRLSELLGWWREAWAW